MTQPLAYIHPEAQIGANVEIGPFTTIDKNVVIGEGTIIGSNVTIYSGARIGKNCKIFPGAVISAVPQDLKFAGEDTTAEIGDNCTLRECVTVNRGTASRGKTVVGNNCLLMAYVHIAHDAVLGNNIILSNACQIAGEVEIDDYVVMGGTSGAHQFVRIGTHAMLQGGSKIGQDIPPYVIGGRARLSYAGINIVGLRRKGFSNEKIEEIQGMYRLIYNSGLNNSAALAKIEETFAPSVERDTILNFIRSSKRGILRGHKAGSSEE
ncbi:MAG: acyl-ACP--UDP-N-acetylglucosamine O-acyltransferase [Breznakibacter sp.]|jgi:UDP-N-acetylglucosamine acyltransferase|nr:acyl-ACP--UDP-N-acetylglucosamine O-acyltransferase [Breznakibacter sp.]